MATRHTLEDRYKAAASLIATGTSIAASQQSRIPASTIRHWQNNDDDFQMMCQEIQAEFGEEIKYKLAEIINESADQTLDRLINGDVVRDTRTGKLVRVPIKGRDAAIIGAVAFDKHRLILNQPTSITGKSDDMNALVQQFREISEKWDEKQVNVVAVQEESEEPG